MKTKTICRMVAMSLVVSAICGCSDSSHDNMQKGKASEEMRKRRNIPKVTDINGGRFVEVLAGSLSPKEGAVYTGPIFSGQVVVFQVIDGGVMCHLSNYWTQDLPSPRSVFVRTDRQYADDDPLKGNNFLCTGRRSYQTVTGANKTIYVFEELSDDIIEQLKEERMRMVWDEQYEMQMQEVKQKIRPASQSGDAYSQTVMGWLHETGTFGMKKDIAEAAKWYGIAAEQGFADAQYHYALCLANGWGVKKNPQEAVRLGAAAIRAYKADPKWSDSITPGWKLRHLYGLSAYELRKRTGDKNVAMELEKGMSVAFRDGNIRRAHAERGDAFAQYLYVCENTMQTNIVEMMKWYRSAAAQGFVGEQIAEVQYLFGRFHASAEGGSNYTEAVKCYTKAAEHGIHEAQVELAIAYDKGLGVETNFIEAAKLYGKIADQGDATAQNRMGEYCRDGLGGIERNIDEAEQWFRKASKQELSDAQFNLADILAEKVYSIVDRKDADDDEFEARERQKKLHGLYKEMKELYEAAAKQGHKGAQYRKALYEMLTIEYDGRRRISDKIFKVAAQGTPYAWEILGASLLSSDFESQEHRYEDVKSAKKIEDFKQYDDSANMLRRSNGEKAQDGTEYENPLSILKAAAKGGNAMAARSLALIYDRSVFHPSYPQTMNEKDAATMAKVVKLYHVAAEQGDPIALCNLATCYLNGWGVEELNTFEAVKLYRKAIEDGTAAHERDVAKLKGCGMSALEKMAWGLYLKTIRWGIASAQFHLGVCLYKAVGVEQNIEEARSMLTLAHKNGCRAAREILSKPIFKP